MEKPFDHDSVVEQWQQHAERNDAANYEFLRSLKFRDYGYDPDELAHELHQQAFQMVDCTRCANCCKTLDIVFEQEDIERIAGALNMSTADFILTYLEADEHEGVYRAKQKPCPFLGNDDRCTIYPIRPTVCRDYPHTDKEGFAARALGTANRALKCPAVFFIVEEMKKRSEEVRRKRRRR